MESKLHVRVYPSKFIVYRVYSFTRYQTTIIPHINV